MMRSAALLVLLVAAFGAYRSLMPTAATSAVVSTTLFVGSAVLFRLLSSFER
jgi:hypothetical protein